MKKGRPRKLCAQRERCLLEEVRMNRYFSLKKIGQRYGLSKRSLETYISRAYLEGAL